MNTSISSFGEGGDEYAYPFCPELGGLVSDGTATVCGLIKFLHLGTFEAEGAGRAADDEGEGETDRFPGFPRIERARLRTNCRADPRLDLFDASEDTDFIEDGIGFFF
jgi:hypothetical protein